MAEPRDLAQQAEQIELRSKGNHERFEGYGVMGLPFSSGHILGLRRFPSSSIGPGYKSVWHRDPQGRWTFYTDQEPLRSCNRYFGSSVDRVERTDIEVEWPGPRSLSISIPTADLAWSVDLAPTLVTRVMNAAGGLLPEPLWRNGFVMDAMGLLATMTLRAGRLRLRGRVPNRQAFIANPRLIWTIPSSRAVIAGEDLGPLGPLAEQAALGDFAIPQRGIFAIGGTIFEPFDSARHLAVPTRSAQQS